MVYIIDLLEMYTSETPNIASLKKRNLHYSQNSWRKISKYNLPNLEGSKRVPFLSQKSGSKRTKKVV